MVSKDKKIGRRLHVRLIDAQTFHVRAARLERGIDNVPQVQNQVGRGAPDDLRNLILADRIRAAVPEGHEADRPRRFERAERFQRTGHGPAPVRTGRPIGIRGVRQEMGQGNDMRRERIGVEQNASEAVVGSELQLSVRRHRCAPDHLRGVAGNVLNEGTTTEVGDQFRHQRGGAVL